MRGMSDEDITIIIIVRNRIIIIIVQRIEI